MASLERARDITDIARRIERVATFAPNPDEGNPDLPKDPWQPRWALKGNWVEFECGCVAERCSSLVDPRAFDPVIFRGLPQQAVYETVCHRHGPGMNKYVGFGHFKTFEQWKSRRKNILMGKVAY